MSLSFSVLRLRDFRVLLFSRVLVTMAMQAQAVIVGWQVYSLTHDPFILGLTGLAEALPAIFCALFSGHIVDSGRPYKIFASCIAALAINMVMLLMVAGGMVHVPGPVLYWIFAGVFLSGMARSFVMPSSFALLSQIVPRPQMPAASAWLTSGFQTGIIAGPTLGGLIYGGYGVRAAWMLPASLMSMAFLLILAISRAPRHWRNVATREPAVKSITAGWRFILNNPVLLSVMALDMFAVLFGGAVAMLPAIADQVLHVGSAGLGALRAAPASGAILTALLLAVRPFRTIRATTLLFVITGFGLCMIGFGLSTSFWLSMGLLAVSGAFDSVSMVIRSTLMQLLTPEAMRGRVSAVNSMFIISSNEIGAFESGLAARLLGLVPSVVFGGVGTLVVVAATAMLSPKLRRTMVDTQEAST